MSRGRMVMGGMYLLCMGLPFSFLNWVCAAEVFQSVWSEFRPYMTTGFKTLLTLSIMVPIDAILLVLFLGIQGLILSPLTPNEDD